MGQSLTFVSVLTASDVDLSKIVQVVALCRVELNSASLGQDLSWTRLNTFKPPALYYRIPVPAYERLTKKFTPTYPLYASSLQQPARHPQVSHRCCAHSTPLNDRLHLS